MKLVSAVVPPERLPHVRRALLRLGVTDLTLSEALGPGNAADPALVVEVAVPEPVVKLTLAAIASAAHARRQAGAPIRVQSLERVIPIPPGDSPPGRDGG